MKFMEAIEKNVSKTLNSLYAKNKKLTYSNRIRLVLRHEYETLNHAYIELGKYYYENLRNNADSDNERLCDVIDGCLERIEKAKSDYYRNTAEQDKAVSCDEESTDDKPDMLDEEYKVIDSDELDDGFLIDESTEDASEIDEQISANENESNLDEMEESYEETTTNTDENENTEEIAIEEVESDTAEKAVDDDENDIPDIIDIATADDLQISDYFENTTETTSFVNIKNEADEQDEIDVNGTASDEIIADAYLQAHNAGENNSNEKEDDDNNVKGNHKAKGFKLSGNWDRLKSEVADDVNYICNSKDSEETD